MYDDDDDDDDDERTMNVQYDECMPNADDDHV